MAGAEEPPLQQLKLRDGRALAFAVYGSELTTEQAVVLYFHGAPSCSVSPASSRFRP